MQKLRAITDQINADFKGVRRNVPGKVGHRLDSSLIRSDCIAFLANGDFQSTGQYAGKTVVGNVASIFYGLADPPIAAPTDKILVRRQKILTYGMPPLVPTALDEEYCKFSLAEWAAQSPFPDPNAWLQKPVIDTTNDLFMFMYMAKGVDDFAIQFARWDPALMDYWWWPADHEIQPGVGLQPLRPIASNAIKFSFTLYDTKGIIENGRRFTHIVYLGE
jgi:hypothetical protein